MLLEVRGLSAKYENFELFSDIDLGLEAGDIACLESEIDVACSRFLECLSGVSTPDSGSVRIDGSALTGGRPKGLIATVMHDEGFPQEESVRIHLERVLGEYDKVDPAGLAAGLLERVGLMHRADHEPWAMSAGEYRRIALELAFTLPQKKLLVLDEPERGLDRRSVDWLVEGMLQQKDAGIAIVCATYDERVAAVADRRVRL